MSFEVNPLSTYFEVLQRASSFLQKAGHSAFVGEWLMKERLNWSKTDLVMHYRDTMPLVEQKEFIQDVTAFLNGQPMQYIIGHEWFFDKRFHVTSDTLIPRPETEEWVSIVLDKLPKQALDVVDIGTGSGAIGITMKLQRPRDNVTLTDISEQTLVVAKGNAKVLGAEVSCKLGDLYEPLQGQTFDVILSNPPYISEDELNVMDQSVIDYEPKTALFAEDNGLRIYKRLAADITAYLKPNGCAFFEIGYKQGEKVSNLFKEALPHASIEIWQDFNGLDRVIAIYT